MENSLHKIFLTPLADLIYDEMDRGTITKKEADDALEVDAVVRGFFSQRWFGGDTDCDRDIVYGG